MGHNRKNPNQFLALFYAMPKFQQLLIECRPGHDTIVLSFGHLCTILSIFAIGNVGHHTHLPKAKSCRDADSDSGFS